MMPRVSVLMPVYNCEPYIARAIESVFEQTYRDFELIVADDGSTDRSGEIAASFPEVRYYARPHSGISPTRNFLLEKVKGEWIAFLDADDLWTPDKLALQMAYLDAHPDCEIIFCRYRNFTDIPDEELSPAQKNLLGREIQNYLPGAVMRKELFDRFGNFSPSCAYGEDTDWTARLIMGGIDISQRLEEFLYLRRVHAGNISLAHSGSGNQSFYAGLAASIRRRMQEEKGKA